MRRRSSRKPKPTAKARECRQKIQSFRKDSSDNSALSASMEVAAPSIETAAPSIEDLDTRTTKQATEANWSTLSLTPDSDNEVIECPQKKATLKTPEDADDATDESDETAAEMKQKSRTNRGRPSAVTQMKQLVSKKNTKITVRFCLSIKKNKTAEKPKNWSDNEQNYSSRIESFCNMGTSYAQLTDQVEAWVNDNTDLQKTADPLFTMAKARSNPNHDKLPFVIDKRKPSMISGDISWKKELEKVGCPFKVTDACRADDDSVEDDDDLLLVVPRRPDSHWEIFIDLYVWCTEKECENTTKLAKKLPDKIMFEIMGIVLKHSDGEYKSADPGILGYFTMSYNEFEQSRFGYIRYLVGKHAMNENMPGYVKIQDGEKHLCFGQKSAAFVPAKHQSDSKKAKVTTTARLRQVVAERMLKANRFVRDSEGSKVLTIRIALGKMNIDDDEFDMGLDSDTDDAVIREHYSQESREREFDSPLPYKKKPKNGRSASVAVANVEELLQKLQKDERSPYYNGICKPLASRVRSRCQTQNIVDGLLERIEDNMWPSKSELFGYNYWPEPERDKYPPDETGDFPDFRDRRDPSLASQSPLNSLAMVLTERFKQKDDATSPSVAQQGTDSISERYRFFRFTRASKFVDVIVGVDLDREFNGKTLYEKALSVDQEDAVGVFAFDDAQMAAIQSRTKRVYLSVADGPSRSLVRFFELKHNVLMSYFKHGVDSLEINVSLHDVVQTSASSNINLH